jgi:hypothetical protein
VPDDTVPVVWETLTLKLSRFTERLHIKTSSPKQGECCEYET